VTTTDGSDCDADPEFDCCAGAAFPPSTAAANTIDAVANRD
jgi:hypothetical protein